MARLRIHLSDGGRQTDREYQHTSVPKGRQKQWLEKTPHRKVSFLLEFGCIQFVFDRRGATAMLRPAKKL